MTKNKALLFARVCATLIFGLVLTASWSSAEPLAGNFETAQARVRAEFATEELWRALPGAEELAARGGLAPRQKAWALREAARVRARTGDAPGAERNLKDALAVLPGDPVIQMELARLLRETRPEEALRYAEDAVKAATSEEGRARARVLAGELRLDLGDAAGAREILGRALEAGEDLDALAAMSRAEIGDASAAASYAERAGRAAERTPWWSRGSAYRLCGRLWLELGEYERAAEAFKRALSVDPDDSDAVDGLLLIRSRRPRQELRLSGETPGEPAEAPPAEEATLRRLEAEPEDLEALRRAVELRRSQGRADEAVALADRFIEAVSDAPPWQAVDAYVAISGLMLDEGGHEAMRRADAAALRAYSLGGEKIRKMKASLILLRTRKEYSPHQDPEELGGVENAGGSFKSEMNQRLQLQDRDEARRTLERGLKLLPESYQLRLALAGFQMEDGQPAKALRNLERLPPGTTLLARSARADAYMLRAKAQHALKDDAAAEKSMEEAVAVDPISRSLEASIALEAEIGHPRRAYEYLDRLVAQAETVFERGAADRLYARTQREFKDEAGAEESLARALALAPEDREALDEMMALEIARGKPNAALAYADRFLAAFGGAGNAALAGVHERMAQAHLALKDEAGAEESLTRALALAPDDREALDEMVTLEIARGNPQGAQAHVERFLTASGAAGSAAASGAYKRMARAQQALKDESGAEASLERALALAPNDREALDEAMTLEISHEKPKAALASAERFLAVTSADATTAGVYKLMAQAQMALKDESGAEASLERASALAPDDREALQRLVAVETARGESKKAAAELERLRQALERALALDPGDWPALRQLAETELKRGSFQDLAALLENPRAAVAGRFEAPWLVWRGLTRAALGDRTQALGDFQAALRSDAEAACFGPELPQERDRLDVVYFDACLKRFPEKAGLYVDRGLAKFEGGQLDAAVADFRRAVSLEPGSAQAQISLVSALATEGRSSDALAAADLALQAVGDRSSRAYNELSSLRRRLDEERRPRR